MEKKTGTCDGHVVDDSVETAMLILCRREAKEIQGPIQAGRNEMRP